MNNKFALLLVMFLTMNFAYAAAGDVFFQDYGNGTIGTNYAGGTSTHFHYNANHQLVFDGNNGNTAMYRTLNNTGNELLNVSFVVFDGGGLWNNGGQQLEIGDSTNYGIDGSKISFVTTFCSQLQTQYAVHNDSVNCPATYPSEGIDRVTGTHRVMYLINQTAGTFRVWFDGVLNQTRTFSPATMNILQIGADTFSQYNYTNITVCDQYCPPTIPPCSPNWSCSSLDACSISNNRACLAVTDANSCGQSFGGNLSTYDVSCTYVPPAAAASSGAGVVYNVQPQTAQKPNASESVQSSDVPTVSADTSTLGNLWNKFWTWLSGLF